MTTKRYFMTITDNNSTQQSVIYELDSRKYDSPSLLSRLAWWMFVRATHLWVSRYMDQWELIKIPTEYGEVYISLSRNSEPRTEDMYTPVSPNGNFDPSRSSLSCSIPS